MVFRKERKVPFIDGFLLSIVQCAYKSDKITDPMPKICFKKALIVLSMTVTCHWVDC